MSECEVTASDRVEVWNERPESRERDGEKVEVRNDGPVRIDSYKRERDYRDRAYGRDPKIIPRRLYDKPQPSKGNDEDAFIPELHQESRREMAV